MVKSQTCMFNGKVIDVDDALERRDAAPGVRLDFQCVQCGDAVRVHKESSHGAAAHFEHLVGNPNCSLSEPA